MIELKDGTYFKAIWNYEFRAGDGVVPVPRDGNLLGALFTTDPERKFWTMTYRFRYYVDDINDNTSQDTKSWYKAEVTGNEASIWESVSKAINMMALATFSTLNCVMIESDESKIQMEKIQELPGMNIQEKQPSNISNLNLN
jgi:hypothetical protein